MASEHKVGTREEWQAAREELAKLEKEHAERNEEIKKKRLGLPWVPVQKEYEFDTEDGKRTLAELFDGRSQLLAYNVMFGPDYEVGACPGCTNVADGLAPGVVEAGRGRAEGRPPGGAELNRLRARGRGRLPHLHGDGARPFRRPLLHALARPDAEGQAGRVPRLAQGRIRRLDRPRQRAPWG
jgi:hypothetical protein